MHGSLPPVPLAPEPQSAMWRWMRGGAESKHAVPHTEPWYKVLWLTGVDYYSTLGYQPGIALLAAGALAPVATALLVLITIFGAVPMYRAVARRSYHGNGSISMLETLLPGWAGKLLTLALLGFAVTAFVITMTLSAADAALHIVENPFLSAHLQGMNALLTIAMLTVLAVVFIRGFREAIGLATWIAIPYLLLNLVVIVAGVIQIVQTPGVLAQWTGHIASLGGPRSLAILSLLAFPKLALGLSGFETGVAVMPLVRGDASDPDPLVGEPIGRIKNTEKLLITAALIMSAVLIGSSVVTTLLIPEEAWHEGGDAAGRALAWVAHHTLGHIFGTIYDISTIAILWFAGASAMAALLGIVPRYLPRFGMAPTWVRFPRPLILVVLGLSIVVTLAFNAQVEAQGGAYATGVLALFLSGAVAVTLAQWTEARAKKRLPWRVVPFGIIALLFAFAFVVNVIERPDGLFIALGFVTGVLVLGALSRYWRATELRVETITFATPECQALLEEMHTRRVHLLPTRSERPSLEVIRARIQKHYKVEGPLATVHITLGQDRSRFDTTLHMRIEREGDDYRITISNAVAVANALAYLSEMVDPKSIFLGLTRQNLVRQSLRYLVWGEGETGLLVYQILLRHWESTPEDDPRPNIFIMSD